MRDENYSINEGNASPKIEDLTQSRKGAKEDAKEDLPLPEVLTLRLCDFACENLPGRY